MGLLIYQTSQDCDDGQLVHCWKIIQVSHYLSWFLKSEGPRNSLITFLFSLSEAGNLFIFYQVVYG